MSDATDSDTRTQRFNDAVRTFELPLPRRQAKLMPLKEGIVELRQKGASLRLIRELLATIDVAVGTDTIARFLAEVNGEQPPQRQLGGVGHGSLTCWPVASAYARSRLRMVSGEPMRPLRKVSCALSVRRHS